MVPSSFGFGFKEAWLTSVDQTWVCIILIVLSIFVTTFEVFLRFGLLSTQQNDSPSLHYNALSRLLQGAVSSSSGGGCVCPGMDEKSNGTGVYH